MTTSSSSMLQRRNSRLPGFRRPSRRRSRNMRSIRSSQNKTTERRLRTYLVNSRLRGWVVQPEGVPGSPDFLFPLRRLAIFVDGCFWHGCPHCGHIPKRNKNYWRAKIARNRKRDAAVSRRLRSQAFSVVRIWECDLRSRPEFCLSKIKRFLRRA